MGVKYVIDTSALLSDPDILFSLPSSEVIIPQIVLSELDRLKVSRADRSLIYRGREVSRMLYGLSKKGKLTDGIAAGNDSIIKVMATDRLKEIPQGLHLKNADDVILALTYNVTKDNPDDQIIIITSDLNMLLRAQTLELKGERIEEKPFKKRFRARLREERELKLLVGAIILLLMGGIISTALYWQGYLLPRTTEKADEKEEQFRIREESFKQVLRDNPRDLPALIGLGELYFANERYPEAIVNYHRALEIEPDDTEVRAHMAISYLYINNYDIALTEFEKVLSQDPSYGIAYYYQGRAFEKKGFPTEAIQQYEAYIEKEPNGEFVDDAEDRISKLKK